MLLLSLNVCAASYKYNISLGDGYTSASYGDDLTEISEKLNMTTDELNSYFNKNGLLYLAVSNDAKTQVRLSAFTDNFSSAVDDISYLSDDQLKEFMNAVSEDGENTCEVITSRGRRYIRVKSTLQDSGGIYTVTQYITICDSKTFYLFCYNEGEDTSSEIQSIFDSFSLTATKAEEPNDSLINVFIIAGIILFAILAVIMIIGIIKSMRNKSADNTAEAKNEL